MILCKERLDKSFGGVLLVVLVFVCWRAKSFCLIKTEALCWCFCFWNFLLVISLENPSFPRLGIWIVKIDSNSTKEKLQNSVAVVADRADLKSCYMQKFRLYETRSVNNKPFSSLINDVSCLHYKYSIFWTWSRLIWVFVSLICFSLFVVLFCVVWLNLIFSISIFVFLVKFMSICIYSSWIMMFFSLGKGI